MSIFGKSLKVRSDSKILERGSYLARKLENSLHVSSQLHILPPGSSSAVILV